MARTVGLVLAAIRLVNTECNDVIGGLARVVPPLRPGLGSDPPYERVW
jgi:hypothetical protein